MWMKKGEWYRIHGYMRMQEKLPKMVLKKDGTISAQMGKVTGVRTAALKEI